MKVRLNTYLRLGEVATYSKGTVFTGSTLGDLPSFVQDLVNEKSRNVTILEGEVAKKVVTPAKSVKNAPRKNLKASDTVSKASSTSTSLKSKKPNIKPKAKKPVVRKRLKPSGDK